MHKNSSKRKPNAFVIILLAIVIGIGVYAFMGISNELTYGFYHVSSEKVSDLETIRIVALADLHNTEFGKDNEELVKKVADIKPDVIVLAGDMIDHGYPDITSLLELCGRLVEIAPVFYGIGNHEAGVLYEDQMYFAPELEALGIPVLENRSYTIEIKGTPVDIGGVTTDVNEFDGWSAVFVRTFVDTDKDHLKVMVSHFPSLYYEKMADEKIDINIGGHFHGGQIQIPFLGGLYCKNFGLFPKYCSGEFDLPGGKLIVSRGLGNTIRFPRLWNNPEIVVIDVNQR